MNLATQNVEKNAKSDIFELINFFYYPSKIKYLIFLLYYKISTIRLTKEKIFVE